MATTADNDHRADEPATSKQAASKVLFTPGPWQYQRGDGRYGCDHYITSAVYSTPTVRSGRDQIAQCHGYDDEVAANARLIAAAPELLEALERIVQRAQCRGAINDGINLKTIRMIARTALTKAGA